MSYQPKVYKEQGGDTQVIASGGAQRVESGGEIDIESGGSLKIAGTAITATAAEINAIAGGGLSSAELGVLDGVTPGTVTASKAVVVDANKDIASVRNLTSTGTATLASATLSGNVLVSGGAAAAAVVARFGQTATEGLEVRVIDEDVTLTNAAATDLTEDVPSGAVILSVQANLDTLVVGDGSGDNGLTKVGIGTSGDPDKYGLTGDLLQNSKVDTIPDWAVLSGAEDIQVFAVDNGGTAVTEKFVGGETVRVRIVYAALNSLDNA